MQPNSANKDFQSAGGKQVSCLILLCPSSLRGCSNITDVGVCLLARQCPRLRQLCVLDCSAVGAVALQTVRRCCRHCAIEHNNMTFY